MWSAILTFLAPIVSNIAGYLFKREENKPAERKNQTIQQIRKERDENNRIIDSSEL